MNTIMTRRSLLRLAAVGTASVALQRSLRSARAAEGPFGDVSALGPIDQGRFDTISWDGRTRRSWRIEGGRIVEVDRAGMWAPQGFEAAALVQTASSVIVMGHIDRTQEWTIPNDIESIPEADRQCLPQEGIDAERLVLSETSLHAVTVDSASQTWRPLAPAAGMSAVLGAAVDDRGTTVALVARADHDVARMPGELCLGSVTSDSWTQDFSVRSEGEVVSAACGVGSLVYSTSDASIRIVRTDKTVEELPTSGFAVGLRDAGPIQLVDLLDPRLDQVRRFVRQRGKWSESRTTRNRDVHHLLPVPGSTISIALPSNGDPFIVEDAEV